MVPAPPEQSVAGHRARRLRAALIDRLDPSNKHTTLNEALLKGIASCDRFLCSGKQSTKDLDYLKQTIGVQFRGAFTTMRPAVSNCSHAATRISTRESISSDTRQSDAASMDWTMPTILLQRKAFIKGGDFDKMAILQDTWAKKDDRTRQSNRKSKMEEQRAVLDSQQREINRRREEALLEKEHEKRQMEASVLEYEKATMNELMKKKERQEATRKLFSEQIQERKELAKRARECEVRDNAIQLQRMNEEDRKEKEAKANQYKTNRLLVQRSQEENRAKLAEKERKEAQKKEEETRYNEECIRICEEREERRSKEVEAIRERQRLMLARGGGPALQNSWEEHMRLDEQRMKKVQREYEQKREASQAAKMRAQKQKTAETMAALDKQIIMKKNRLQQEASENEEEGRQLLKARCLEIEQAKRDMALRKSKQRSVLMDQKKRLEAEAQQRFIAWQGGMNENDMKIHKNVVNGTQRGFTTLPSLETY